MHSLFVSHRRACAGSRPLVTSCAAPLACDLQRCLLQNLEPPKIPLLYLCVVQLGSLGCACSHLPQRQQCCVQQCRIGAVPMWSLATAVTSQKIVTQLVCLSLVAACSSVPVVRYIRDTHLSLIDFLQKAVYFSIPEDLL